MRAVATANERSTQAGTSEALFSRLNAACLVFLLAVTPGCIVLSKHSYSLPYVEGVKTSTENFSGTIADQAFDLPGLTVVVAEGRSAEARPLCGGPLVFPVFISWVPPDSRRLFTEIVLVLDAHGDESGFELWPYSISAGFDDGSSTEAYVVLASRYPGDGSALPVTSPILVGGKSVLCLRFSRPVGAEIDSLTIGKLFDGDVAVPVPVIRFRPRASRMDIHFE